MWQKSKNNETLGWINFFNKAEYSEFLQDMKHIKTKLRDKYKPSQPIQADTYSSEINQYPEPQVFYRDFPLNRYDALEDVVPSKRSSRNRRRRCFPFWIICLSVFILSAAAIAAITTNVISSNKQSAPKANTGKSLSNTHIAYSTATSTKQGNKLLTSSMVMVDTISPTELHISPLTSPEYQPFSSMQAQASVAETQQVSSSVLIFSHQSLTTMQTSSEVQQETSSLMTSIETRVISSLSPSFVDKQTSSLASLPFVTRLESPLVQISPVSAQTSSLTPMPSVVNVSSSSVTTFIINQQQESSSMPSMFQQESSSVLDLSVGEPVSPLLSTFQQDSVSVSTSPVTELGLSTMETSPIVPQESSIASSIAQQTKLVSVSSSIATSPMTSSTDRQRSMSSAVYVESSPMATPAMNYQEISMTKSFSIPVSSVVEQILTDLSSTTEPASLSTEVQSSITMYSESHPHATTSPTTLQQSSSVPTASEVDDTSVFQQTLSISTASVVDETLSFMVSQTPSMLSSSVVELGSSMQTSLISQQESLSLASLYELNSNAIETSYKGLEASSMTTFESEQASSSVGEHGSSVDQQVKQPMSSNAAELETSSILQQESSVALSSVDQQVSSLIPTFSATELISSGIETSPTVQQESSVASSVAQQIASSMSSSSATDLPFNGMETPSMYQQIASTMSPLSASDLLFSGIETSSMTQQESVVDTTIPTAMEPLSVGMETSSTTEEKSSVASTSMDQQATSSMSTLSSMAQQESSVASSFVAQQITSSMSTLSATQLVSNEMEISSMAHQEYSLASSFVAQQIESSFLSLSSTELQSDFMETSSMAKQESTVASSTVAEQVAKAILTLSDMEVPSNGMTTSSMAEEESSVISISMVQRVASSMQTSPETELLSSGMEASYMTQGESSVASLSVAHQVLSALSATELVPNGMSTFSMDHQETMSTLSVVELESSEIEMSSLTQQEFSISSTPQQVSWAAMIMSASSPMITTSVPKAQMFSITTPTVYELTPVDEKLFSSISASFQSERSSSDSLYMTEQASSPMPASSVVEVESLPMLLSSIAQQQLSVSQQETWMTSSIIQHLSSISMSSGVPPESNAIEISSINLHHIRSSSYMSTRETSSELGIFLFFIGIASLGSTGTFDDVCTSTRNIVVINI